MLEEQNIINGIPIESRWRSHRVWLPTLYLTRGLPYVILFMTSMVYFNRAGLSNGSITLTTSWFLLPFILRPLLGRLVVGYGNKRFWIVLTELVLALSLAGLAVTGPSVHWFEWSVLFLLTMATAGALHDVAVERLYKREAALRHQEVFFDARAAFYLLAILVGMAVPVTVAGNLEVINRTIHPSWQAVFWMLSALLSVLMVFHAVVLPKDILRADLPIWSGVTRQWWHDVKAAFVRRPHYVANLCFLFCFLIPEGMFFRIVPLFLIDPGSNGGLALSPQELGLVLGTVGTFSLIAGCAVGTRLVRRDGLRRWLWLFVIALTLPKFLFVYLSYYFVSTLSIINFCMLAEQFGTGIGLTAYFVWLAYCTRGAHSTFTYSLGTAITAFSVVMSGWFTGFLQEYVGYRRFFLLVACLGVVSFVAAGFVPVTDEAGKKGEAS
ncbi:MFS transporter [Prevotella multiformis]|uniref:MFS transporter n=1 Tax=Prevotella multiformis TaxID=282402 RepID=UPI001BA7B2C1|nr:MFS transporter [Prevotella multiformis]QUB70903.1 MFS transporter [Prevotella multiformis]